MESVKRFMRYSTFAYRSRFGVMDWKKYILFTLLTPVIQMLCFSMVAKYANGGEMERWFIGNALILTYMSTLFGVGTQFSNERRLGTLGAIIAAPSSKLATFLPRTVLFIFEGVLNIIVGFIFGLLFFGLNIPLSKMLSLLLLCFIASFAATGFGVLISSLALLTRDLNLLLNVMSMAMLGLTGANFPLERLPKVLSFIPNLLPLTRSIKLSQIILNGGTISNNMYLVVSELFVGIIFAVLGIALFKYIERQAVVKGTLDLL